MRTLEIHCSSVAAEPVSFIASNPSTEKKKSLVIDADSNLSTSPELQKVPSSNDLKTLRAILLGKDYDELLAFKESSQNPTQHSQTIANIVSEALAIRSAKDDSIAMALAPTIQKALASSINDNPKPIADALYPVMGPAIRKSISEALSQMLETFNQLLEQSLSPKSFLWRLDAWRTGRSYSEVILLKTLVYQVEEVFLINREDGLLLQHASLDTIIIQDSDMVSGMLTAIQDFVGDSFSVEEGDHAGLNMLRLGDLSVIIEHGPKAILAAVIRGKPPENIRRLLTLTLEAIHHQHRHDFKQYKGDNSYFDQSKPLLQRCLKIQKQEQKSSRLPLYMTLSVLMLGAGYWGLIKYQQNQHQQQTELVAQAIAEKEQSQWQAALSALRAEPGLVIINTEQRVDDIEIEVLLDPLARQPSQVVSHLAIDKPIIFKTRPYLSVEDEIILLRAKQILHVPSEVNLSVENAILRVSGDASLKWSDRLHKHWSQVTGVYQLNTDGLRSYDANILIINALKQEIEQSNVLFANNDASLNAISQARIKSVSHSLDKLIRLAKQSHKLVKITLIGNADSKGAEHINAKLTLQRIRAVKKEIVARGISKFSFVNRTTRATPIRNERSVHYQINIIEAQ